MSLTAQRARTALAWERGPGAELVSADCVPFTAVHVTYLVIGGEKGSTAFGSLIALLPVLLATGAGRLAQSLIVRATWHAGNVEESARMVARSDRAALHPASLRAADRAMAMAVPARLTWGARRTQPARPRV